MKRLERDALMADRATVEGVISRLSGGDIVGQATFGARLSAIDSRLAALDEQIETGGSVALMFGGGPVTGSRAIDAEFATEILDNFQSLVSKRVALDELGSLGQRGPVPERAAVHLAITEMLRG